MFISPIGKFLKKYRIDHYSTQRKMAKAMGITSSYLCAMETGIRPFSKKFHDSFLDLFPMSEEEKADFEKAFLSGVTMVRIVALQGSFSEEEVALIRLFEEKLPTLSSEQIQSLQEILDTAKKRSDTP